MTSDDEEMLDTWNRLYGCEVWEGEVNLVKGL